MYLVGGPSPFRGPRLAHQDHNLSAVDIAAYLTPEYENASVIPTSELSQFMLRHDLLFQPRPGVSKIEAVQHGRTAVKTVLASYEYRLTHATVTPYEIFRALNNGDSANWGAGLFDADLLIIRARGDDRRRKKNDDPIDYLLQLNNLVGSRSRNGLPTWLIASAHCTSNFFKAAYDGGASDLTELLLRNCVEAVFGDVAQDRVRFTCRSALLIDPQTGEHQIRGEQPFPLSWASSETLREGPSKPKVLSPSQMIRDPNLAGVGVDQGYVVPRTTAAPSQEPTERIPKSAAYLKIADGYIKSFAAETQRIKQRVAAERRNAETSDPDESTAPRPATINPNRSSRMWVDGFIPPRVGPIVPRRKFVSQGRSQTEDDGGANDSAPASEEEE
jgi:hypothetical protein